MPRPASSISTTTPCLLRLQLTQTVVEQLGEKVGGAGDRVAYQRYFVGTPNADSLILLGLPDRRKQNSAYKDGLVETPAGLAPGQNDEVLQEAPRLGELMVDVKQIRQQRLVADPVL
jgi:hypothetical protein